MNAGALGRQGTAQGARLPRQARLQVACAKRSAAGATSGKAAGKTPRATKRGGAVKTEEPARAKQSPPTAPANSNSSSSSPASPPATARAPSTAQQGGARSEPTSGNGTGKQSAAASAKPTKSAASPATEEQPPAKPPAASASAPPAAAAPSANRPSTAESPASSSRDPAPKAAAATTSSAPAKDQDQPAKAPPNAPVAASPAPATKERGEAAAPAPTPAATPAPAPAPAPGSAPPTAAAETAAEPRKPTPLAEAPKPTPKGDIKEARQRYAKAAPRPQGTDKPLDLVFVSAEVAPWSKTGGLGDVVGSLPIALAARGHRVMVVAPRYQTGGKNDALYTGAVELPVRAQLDMGGAGTQEVGYWHLHRDHVDFVFVDHQVYRRPGNPYGDEKGNFGDNLFRYALLSLAGCEAPLQLHIGGYRSGDPPGFPYGDKVMFIANDWHTGLVPCYLAAKYRRNGVYKDARCMFAIHNLSHQGVEPAQNFQYLGLPDDWYDPISWEYPSWASENPSGAAINLLKGALVACDRILTVSQGYAWEITTKEGGWGLHGVLQDRQHVINGVVNGIDMEEWDPSTDSHLEANYSADDLEGKAACKAALQKELGLEVNPKVPLVGWIGRLDYQKGPDIALDTVPGLIDRFCQVVMLGSGVAKYEEALRAMEGRYPQAFRGWVGFSIPVAHRLIAGADILLMPSRFEPCGLNQLFAMRYGTIPVAHATGGLRDTIQQFNGDAKEPEEMGSGWVFSPPERGAMLGAVDAALAVRWDRPEAWRALQRNGMAQNLSWDRSAQEYEKIFGWALMDQAVRPW